MREEWEGGRNRGEGKRFTFNSNLHSIEKDWVSGSGFHL
jgi:hypothetical protein